MGKTGKIIIISAPSGTGKSTIINKLMAMPDLDLKFSVSATNRAPREGEKDGINYYFLTTEEFTRKIEEDAFVEYEEVYAGRYYGTLKSEVSRILNDGHNLILDIDVKGGINVKKLYPDAAAIFILPPSIDILRQRLINRGTDDEETINQRVAKAEYELSFASKYDYSVVNDDLEKAVKETKTIIRNYLESDKDFYLNDAEQDQETNNQQESNNESEGSETFEDVKKGISGIINLDGIDNTTNIEELVELVLDNGYLLLAVNGKLAVLDTSIGEPIYKIEESTPENYIVYRKDNTKIGEFRLNKQGSYDFYPESKPISVFQDQVIDSLDMKALYNTRPTIILRKNFTSEEKTNYERYYLTAGMVNNIVQYFTNKNQPLPKLIKDILLQYNYNLEENNCTSIISNIKSIII